METPLTYALCKPHMYTQQLHWLVLWLHVSIVMTCMKSKLVGQLDMWCYQLLYE